MKGGYEKFSMLQTPPHFHNHHLTLPPTNSPPHPTSPGSRNSARLFTANRLLQRSLAHLPQTRLHSRKTLHKKLCSDETR